MGWVFLSALVLLFPCPLVSSFLILHLIFIFSSYPPSPLTTFLSSPWISCAPIAKLVTQATAPTCMNSMTRQTFWFYESCFGFSVNLYLIQEGTHPHPDSSQEIFTQGDFDSVLFTLLWRLFYDLVFPLRLLRPEALFVFNFMSSFWPGLKMVRMLEQLSSLRGHVLSWAWLAENCEYLKTDKNRFETSEAKPARRRSGQCSMFFLFCTFYSI